MTYAEKFQLYVAAYAGMFTSEMNLLTKLDLLRTAQSVVVKDPTLAADEAALQLVLWKIGHAIKPSWV